MTDGQMNKKRRNRETNKVCRNALKSTALQSSLLLGGLACAVPAVSAQDANTETAMEEVVVTARKRSESVYDVPISINVMSSDAIDKLGAHDFTDLISSVPSLGAYQNGPGRTRLSIRGVNSTSSSNGNDNETQNQETVGIYVDEIPISLASLSPELGLFDASRVEVLRGPQGTLYGAGSMAGTLRVVTNKPNTEEFEGKLDVTLSDTAYASKHSYDVKALVNIPIAEDKVALRMSGYHKQAAGYIDNVTTGEKDVNDGRSAGGRFALRATPNEKLTADFVFMYHEYSDNGRTEDTDSTPLYSRDYTSFDGYDDQIAIYNLTLKYDMDNMSLVSSSSYFDRSVFNRRSIDTFYGLPGILPEGVDPHELEDLTDVNAFVQEVRLSSDTDSDFQWTVGGYYDYRDIDGINSWPVPGLDEGAANDPAFEPASNWGAPDDYFLYATSDQRVETFAFFGEAYYTWDKLTVTAGLRYFNWKQKLSDFESGQLIGETDPQPSTYPVGKEDGFNPKLNISYKISDDLLVYGQAAKGFRYGGTNTGEVPVDLCGAEAAEAAASGEDPQFFRPDKLWNYEVGFKGTTNNRKLSFNAAAFYIDWSDMQNSRRFECGFSFRSNVGKASSKGLELELTANLTDQLIATFGGAYTDAKLDETVESLTAFEGDRVPYVPEFAFSGSLEYDYTISDDLEGFVWGNVQYVGDRGSEFSKTNTNYRHIEAYTLANFRTGIRNERYEASIFFNNAFASKGVIRAQRRFPFDPDASLRVKPRTIGVNLKTYF
ncbi:TonB-dependent receptor [Kordiimonas sediminis]|nr:TonB-dependent receptor [Kordiimonas sediminis]